MSTHIWVNVPNILSYIVETNAINCFFNEECFFPDLREKINHPTLIFVEKF